MKKNKNAHDRAWELLDEKGLTLSEKMMVRSSFIEWSNYKNEYPFIEIGFRKNGVQYYHSTYTLIKHLMFDTEKEVVLANAIYLNLKELNDNIDFLEVFKYTCRVIGLDNGWSN